MKNLLFIAFIAFTLGACSKDQRRANKLDGETYKTSSIIVSGGSFSGDFSSFISIEYKFDKGAKKGSYSKATVTTSSPLDPTSTSADVIQWKVEDDKFYQLSAGETTPDVSTIKSFKGKELTIEQTSVDSDGATSTTTIVLKKQ